MGYLWNSRKLGFVPSRNAQDCLHFYSFFRNQREKVYSSVTPSNSKIALHLSLLDVYIISSSDDRVKSTKALIGMISKVQCVLSYHV